MLAAFFGAVVGGFIESMNSVVRADQYGIDPFASGNVGQFAAHAGVGVFGGLVGGILGILLASGISAAKQRTLLKFAVGTIIIGVVACGIVFVLSTDGVAIPGGLVTVCEQFTVLCSTAVGVAFVSGDADD
ncbi:phosphotransferase system glucose/maltose/N-acetylglucosamine-specific IIC component [Actinomadura coerulea]|uniref:Phosphotransferase system glucose/maltose/N-acetylglucosamine-specific IIC component n=1 Tax=Actinomadura coerulea TaxID=46159 RepID=A0A7X0L0B2_9ACTN|nr:hypothetical protein [Actinomadura coerulea]MBB6396994.1 phosphotransferase system glucose/maltose/N-acetylglucosamine-specific IIC component [Actinomadura coerulea]GGP95873.1 hypothetical protein GCM10010187_09350 [Actinomadura coerulea]